MRVQRLRPRLDVAHVGAGRQQKGHAGGDQGAGVLAKLDHDDFPRGVAALNFVYWNTLYQ
jgi:hypothetical protein